VSAIRLASIRFPSKSRQSVAKASVQYRVEHLPSSNAHTNVAVQNPHGVLADNKRRQIDSSGTVKIQQVSIAVSTSVRWTAAGTRCLHTSTHLSRVRSNILLRDAAASFWRPGLTAGDPSAVISRLTVIKPAFGASASGLVISARTVEITCVPPILTSADPSALQMDPMRAWF
jgi:hypothetical protein